MNFLKNLWRKKLKIGSYFGATPHELRSFMIGMGETMIEKDRIHVSNYPFRPSGVFPNKSISTTDIDEIHLTTSPCTLKIGVELVFISKEKENSLRDFAERNNILTTQRASNWDLITEPFLDTEFDTASQALSLQRLAEHGIHEEEVKKLREEIGNQMYKYNFDTMLWDWVNLSLYDVLSAMAPSLDAQSFEAFFWRAMEIEQRRQIIR